MDRNSNACYEATFWNDPVQEKMINQNTGLLNCSDVKLFVDFDIINEKQPTVSIPSKTQDYNSRDQIL